MCLVTFEHSSADPKFAFPSKLELVRSGKEGNQKWMLLSCACKENLRVFLG
ncbi:hypothetical protein PVK06_038114 [Gossypium arboreum]|uniref:Uncharacterized protein n=1 Tax=Gossypium arboreum TaxID=29729 RepID=A0ABR0MZ82_GOSAR|nr:hypothetical protein PVK06_038114 [Gossypium arboreum]